MRGKGVANADALVWQYGPAAPPSCIFQKRFHARGGVPSFHLGRATLQAASSASKRPVLRVVVGEHDLAVLVSLAPANPDDLAVAIKVADLRLVASDTRSPAPYRVARIARWPRFFGASSKALTSSLLRMTGSFFSYLGNGIRSISIWRFRVLR